MNDPQRRRRVTLGRAREVAQIYRQAVAAGEPPTVAVAGHFKVSHSTATRWVAAARRLGELGPAVGTQPGEAVALGADEQAVGEGRTDTSTVVTSRVRALRRSYGWSAGTFAEKCRGVGASWITGDTIANAECGRRRQGVSVDELLVFAEVLSVPALALLPASARNCGTCHGSPPVGFVCQHCGARGVA